MEKVSDQSFWMQLTNAKSADELIMAVKSKKIYIYPHFKALMRRLY